MRKAWLGLALVMLLTGCGPSGAPGAQATPTSAAPPATPAPPAQSVVFDGDSYFMVDAVDTRGGTLKEFLLDGETFDDYTRKLSFRLTPGKDLRVHEKGLLAQLEATRPGLEQRVMYRSRKQLDEDLLFPDGEYQLWAWRLTPRGIESFEFAVRAKDKVKLKALVDSKREHWRKELERMGKTIPTILKPSP